MGEFLENQAIKQLSKLEEGVFELGEIVREGVDNIVLLTAIEHINRAIEQIKLANDKIKY